MNILNEIADKTRDRIEEEKRRLPLAELKARIREQEAQKREQEARIREQEAQTEGPKARSSFREALKRPGMSYICEVKKASPSKGLIAPDFPYLAIAGEYEQAGAAAVSCLTEPFYFLGADAYLREIAQKVSLPVLRKDFTVDEYMIYQARELGAAAVLLICGILDDVQLRDFLELAKELGLDALTEVHDEAQTERALRAGAQIIGVNNRDLRTFQVDMNNSLRLRRLVPEEVVFVSESGIKGPEEIRLLRENRVDGVLVGETLMRNKDKRAQLAYLDGCGRKV